MLGVLINAGAIAAGGALGLLLKKGLPERLSDIVMKALALSVIFIGISGLTGGGNTLVLIISMVVGAIIGELLKLEQRLNNLGDAIQKKVAKNGGFTEGFVTASMLFCVGAMAVVGSLKAGMNGDNSVLISKALIDGIAALLFASSLGWGVICSSVCILIYEGALVLLSGVVAPYLSDAVITQLSTVGSLLILGIGTNMLGLTKLKVMNMLPAVFIPILLMLIPYFNS